MTTPSIRPAKPKTKPDCNAAWVLRPIATSGSSSWMRGSLAARSESASIETSSAGSDDAAEVLAVGRDRVDVDRGAEVDREAAPADPLVGGDGVDEAIGAELVRVVDQDRHPRPGGGADEQERRGQDGSRRAARTRARAGVPPSRR